MLEGRAFAGLDFAVAFDLVVDLGRGLEDVIGFDDELLLSVDLSLSVVEVSNVLKVGKILVAGDTELPKNGVISSLFSVLFLLF